MVNLRDPLAFARIAVTRLERFIARHEQFHAAIDWSLLGADQEDQRRALDERLEEELNDAHLHVHWLEERNASEVATPDDAGGFDPDHWSWQFEPVALAVPPSEGTISEPL